MLANFVLRLPNPIAQRLTQLFFRARMWRQGIRKLHSNIDYNAYKTMDVKILPALSDNYMYMLVDKSTNNAAVIDPVEPDTVLQAVQQNGVALTTVLTTHHHWDHAGGNEKIKQMMPHLQVYGGDSRIGGLTHMVKHDDTFKLGNLNIKCLYTPCHTKGHICYYVESTGDETDRVVFTGDTLFLGGCGRFFEGTANEMYNALLNVLANLPGDTKVYCGHEYSLGNLKFAQHVEPNNEELLKKAEWCTNRRQQGMPTVPSTIDEEKLYNPFMRVLVPSVMQYAGMSDPISTMKQIRASKDNFKG